MFDKIACVLPAAALLALPALAQTPHTCHWTFPGGTPSASTDCNPPLVTFATPGIKRVTLKVCVGALCSSTTQPVEVLDPKPRILTLKPSTSPVYPGDTIMVSAEVSGHPPLTYLWSAGSATATTNPATFTVPANTSRLSISLSLANSSGASRSTVSIPVADPRPRGSIRVTPNPVYVGQILSADVPDLRGKAPFTYKWTLTPDGISSTLPTFSWTTTSTTKPGLRRLELLVSNSAGTANIARSVRLELPPIAVSFSPDCPSLCFFPIDQAVTFKLTLAPEGPLPTRYEYDWNGDGTFDVTSPHAITAHAFTAPGSYRPRVRISSGSRAQLLLSTRIVHVSKSTQVQE